MVCGNVCVMSVKIALLALVFCSGNGGFSGVWAGKAGDREGVDGVIGVEGLRQEQPQSAVAKDSRRLVMRIAGCALFLSGS